MWGGQFNPKTVGLIARIPTSEAARADTDPPPGDGDRDPTVRMKSFTSILTSGPSRSSDIMYLQHMGCLSIASHVRHFTSNKKYLKLLILISINLRKSESIFGLPWTASQYCFGNIFPVWNFPAFYFMHANCPNGDGNQSSFRRFRYYYVNYRTFARR